MKQVIFIDFDGTICPYGQVSEPPFEGCVDTINTMMDKGFHVTIFSCRGNKEVVRDMPASVAQMVEYLTTHGIRYTDIYYGKPLYDVLIDDRAVGFTDDWSVIRKRVLGNG